MMNLPIQINNTPHENWLLWHSRKGKETKKVSPLELHIIQLKEELEKIKKHSEKDKEWVNSYKKLV